NLVGQRFRSKEEYFVLAGKFGHGEADVGQKRAGEHVEAFARGELLRDADRIPRVAAVIARDELDLLAEHAACGVDLIDGEIETLFVRLQKRRLRLVAVELADADRLL